MASKYDVFWGSLFASNANWMTDLREKKSVILPVEGIEVVGARQNWHGKQVFDKTGSIEGSDVMAHTIALKRIIPSSLQDGEKVIAVMNTKGTKLTLTLV